MTSELMCPECGKKVEKLPIREPIQEGVTSMTMNLSTAATYIGPSYSPSLFTYKCSNPKCWVTKVELSWY